MPARLTFLTGSLERQSFDLGRRIKIGRGSSADIAFAARLDPKASRRHATLSFENGRYVLRDLGSTNGTLVNGQEIRERVLSYGDVIQFGRGGPTARFEPSARADASRGAEAFEAPTRSMDPIGHPSVPASGPRERSRRSGRSQGTTEYVRRLVERASERAQSKLRLAVGLFAVLALVSAGLAFFLGTWIEGRDAFAGLAERYESSVVMIEVGAGTGEFYNVFRDAAGVGFGTGFFVSTDGLIVTNKHVIQPYKFTREGAEWACLVELATGKPIDEVLTITVWIGGTEFRLQPDQPSDRTLGFSTDGGTLSIERLADDRFSEEFVDVPCDAGRNPHTFRWRRHEVDNNDIAILRAQGTAFDPIPLSSESPGAGLPVMVIGFPSGTTPLEGVRALPIANTGEVIRTQQTIQHDARVIPGNSGGPLLDEEGAAVGITTRGVAESLSMALRIDFARELLDAIEGR